MISFYGGLFSVLPAYLADVFGPKHVGAIHGRTLTAWSAAAVLGPNFLGYMRHVSETNAVKDLVASIEPAAFHQAFNAPVADLSELLKAKTVTIPRLLELAPPGSLLGLGLCCCCCCCCSIRSVRTLVNSFCYSVYYEQLLE